MVEEPEYMTLQDWLLYNLRVYGVKVGFDDPAMNNALVFLSSYAWDQVLLAEVGVEGERFIEKLIETCIDDPTTRDEDLWEEYMECVAESLKPFVDALRVHLEDLHEKIKQGVKEAIGELRGG